MPHSTLRTVLSVGFASLVAITAPARAEPTENDLKILAEQQMQSELRLRQLAAEAEAAAQAEEEATTRLIDQARAVTEQETALLRIEKRSSALKQSLAEKALVLAAKQDVVAELLAGLQRLEMNPPPALVVSPDDVLAALRSAMLFDAIVPEMAAEAKALRAELEDMLRLKQQLAEESEQKKLALASLADARRALEDRLQERQRLRAEANTALEAERKRNEELASKARSLQELLDRLAENRAIAEAERQAAARAAAEELLRQEAEAAALKQKQEAAEAALREKKAAEEELQRQKLAAEAEALRKQQAEAEAKAAALKQKQLEQEAQAKRIAEARKLKPPLVFSKSKGQLPWPVAGELILAYGADSGLGSTLDGIVIGTGEAAQVLSPADGRVEFAGKFRSYGEMVIIDPGEGYLVLLAGLEKASATTGELIRAGEPVGAMGVKPSRLALANDLSRIKTPVLYVEFRKDGKPVDPSPWWSGNRQEAMR